MSSNKELFDVISKNFGIQDFSNELDSESAYLKELQRALAARVQHMIRVDLDRLLQALYRIDVPQSESDMAFGLGEIGLVSMKLSEVIIKRQLQKIEYARKFYSKSN